MWMNVIAISHRRLSIEKPSVEIDGFDHAFSVRIISRRVLLLDGALVSTGRAKRPSNTETLFFLYSSQSEIISSDGCNGSSGQSIGKIPPMAAMNGARPSPFERERD